MCEALCSDRLHPHLLQLTCCLPPIRAVAVGSGSMGGGAEEEDVGQTYSDQPPPSSPPLLLCFPPFISLVVEITCPLARAHHQSHDS